VEPIKICYLLDPGLELIQKSCTGYGIGGGGRAGGGRREGAGHQSVGEESAVTLPVQNGGILRTRKETENPTSASTF